MILVLGQSAPYMGTGASEEASTTPTDAPIKYYDRYATKEDIFSAKCKSRNLLETIGSDLEPLVLSYWNAKAGGHNLISCPFQRSISESSDTPQSGQHSNHDMFFK